MSANRLEKRSDQIKFNGRILFLTEDTALIRKQLEATGDEAQRIEDELAARLANDNLPLMNNISTDEITPGWVCFHYDETLGEYVYVGMRDAAVRKDEVKNGGFAVVVSGLSKGCGSSRETAPYAEKWAGIQLVIAQSIEKIYGQNSQNIGLLTSTDFGSDRSRSSRRRDSAWRNSPKDSIQFQKTSSSTAGCSITTRRVWRAKFRRRPLRVSSSCSSSSMSVRAVQTKLVPVSMTVGRLTRRPK